MCDVRRFYTNRFFSISQMLVMRAHACYYHGVRIFVLNIIMLLQDEIKKCIAQCEKAVDMVNMLHLFSSNESIEEVASNEIKCVSFLTYNGLKKSHKPCGSIFPRY